jgi:hypothetical protein
MLLGRNRVASSHAAAVEAQPDRHEIGCASATAFASETSRVLSQLPGVLARLGGVDTLRRQHKCFLGNRVQAFQPVMSEFQLVGISSLGRAPN